MGREIKRVPVDFAFPVDQTWTGYLMPDDLNPLDCLDCAGRGYSPQARHFHDLWYGYAPFLPFENGSRLLMPDTPAVRAFAERNVARSPDSYGRGDAAIHREALRLIDMWNGQWSHHLNADDVAALLAAGRLMDFTHTWTRGEGWQPKDPPVVPTPDEVNAWHIMTMGHDSINASVCIKARCEREGVPYLCGTCDGSGARWRDDAHKAAHDAWERSEPPSGDGWQLWQTVSEGGPCTPVFASAAELVDYLTSVGDGPVEYRKPWSRAAAEAMVREGWAPSLVATSNGVFANGEALVEMNAGDPS